MGHLSGLARGVLLLALCVGQWFLAHAQQAASEVPPSADSTFLKTVSADKKSPGDGRPSPSAGAQPANAGSSDSAELAKKLSNPVASLISVPFQSNFDFGMGPNEDGFRYTLNVQPVIPFTLNNKWNLISRTITPIIYQSDVIGASSQAGLGDIVQSFFFSPQKTTPFIWGIGPALLIPAATDDLLGAGQFGLGPTFVLLKQKKGWTYGALMNHIWSVVGEEGRSDVSSTFLQPFLAYTTRTAWTYSINTESTYDWEGERWSVPIHAQVSKVVKYGAMPVSYAGALRCWATSAPGGPQGCGFRVTVTMLFPKSPER